jgi:hypothetical protein
MRQTYELEASTVEDHMDVISHGADVTVRADAEYGTSVHVRLPTGQILMVGVQPDYEDDPKVFVTLEKLHRQGIDFYSREYPQLEE